MFEDLFLMSDKKKSIVFIIIILTIIILMGKVFYTSNVCISIEEDKLKAIINAGELENKKECRVSCEELFEVWNIDKSSCKDFCGSRGCYNV